MFVIAKVNFFDNDLRQTFKEYPSLLEAYQGEARKDLVAISPEDGIEEIKEAYFRVDMLINIVRV